MTQQEKIRTLHEWLDEVCVDLRQLKARGQLHSSCQALPAFVSHIYEMLDWQTPQDAQAGATLVG